MSFFKSNTTTTTTATENTATQETGNSNGGLIKGLAIAVGTVAGIGLAAFGGKKAYQHFHVKDENNMENVTVNDDEFDEFFEDEDDVEEVTENTETVESFNEVETEEPANEEPVEAEEAKTEETTNNATVEEKSETETRIDELTSEVSNLSKIETASDLEAAIKKIDELVGQFGSEYRTIGQNAKIGMAKAKLHIEVSNYWEGLRIAFKDLTPVEISDFFAGEIDIVSTAYMEMKYIKPNESTIEEMNKTVREFNHYARMAANASEKAVEIRAGETKTAPKSSDETQAEETKSVGKTKTTDTSDIESIAKESVARESLEKRLGNLRRLQKDNDDDADVQIMRDIAMIDFNIETLRKLNVSDIHDLETIACRCGSLAIEHYATRAASAIKNTNLDTHDNLITISARLITIKGVVDKLENILIYPKTRVHLEKAIKFAGARDKELFQIKLENAKNAGNKTADEKQAAKSVVDEIQATTKESPSETQIGNSEVISDDGETVTLKASVSEESVQNVKAVIDIVSKIPSREDPEKNDMPYFIRVIGGKIAGITEPEATFLAYNAETKSNDFIDACVSLCNMVGNGICNLADQKSDPISSIGWIQRSYDELIASGAIDNTYNPQSMRKALTDARDEAVRVLTNMIKPDDLEDHIVKKTSDETQADETAATVEPETAELPVDVTPEVNEAAEKIRHACQLLKDGKAQEAKEYYKTNLTPYLVDENLSKETRNAIESINTRATNMMMSEKQQAAKAAKAAAKASKKSKKNSRRNRR